MDYLRKFKEVEIVRSIRGMVSRTRRNGVILKPGSIIPEQQQESASSARQISFQESQGHQSQTTGHFYESRHSSKLFQEEQFERTEEEFLIPLTDTEQFFQTLHEANICRQRATNMTKRKVKLFEQLQLQPIYLSGGNFNKLLKFEFELGPTGFLQRIELLYEQLNQVDRAIENILFRGQVPIYEVFAVIDRQLMRSLQGLRKIRCMRDVLKGVEIQREKKTADNVLRRILLIQKLSLLKSLKRSNAACLVQGQTLEDVFQTERTRFKLYARLNNAGNLHDKAYFLQSIGRKLFKIAENSVQIVQHKLQNWVANQLSHKEIEKLAIVIYFIETEPLYVDQRLHLDYSKVDTAGLRAQLQQVKLWKDYRYLRDTHMKGKMQDFLSALQAKLAE